MGLRLVARAMYFSFLTCYLDAEDAAKDDGMVSGPLDLSYMGVYTVWTNSLGKFSCC
jgi:hypothetical protein